MTRTTACLLALAALQQCAMIVNGFQAQAFLLLSRNAGGRRSVSSSSSSSSSSSVAMTTAPSLLILAMVNNNNSLNQRQSILGGTKPVSMDVGHTPVVPQDDNVSSSSLSASYPQQQQGQHSEQRGSSSSNPNAVETVVVGNKEENNDPTKKMMQQIKDAGLAGVISYALWELGFWSVSIPLTIIGYQQVTGHWPDLSDKDDVAKLSAEAFAFVNFARFAVPLRIGLALSTTPWIQSNVVDKFIKKDTDATATTTAGQSKTNGDEA